MPTWHSAGSNVGSNNVARLSRSGLAIIALSASLVAGHALAQSPAAAPAAPAATAAKPLWNELTAAQKAALEPLAAEWDTMDSARKATWLEIGNRFSAMKPDEQQRVHERMREWLQLTPEQRRLARENYAQAKKIDKSQKSAKWDEYQQLPEEEKKKLAAAAAKKQAGKSTVTCPPGSIVNTAAAQPPCVPAPPTPAAPTPAAPNSNVK